MNPQLRPVFERFAKVLVVLAALGAACLVLTLVGFHILFRVREKAPVSEAEAKGLSVYNCRNLT